MNARKIITVFCAVSASFAVLMALVMLIPAGIFRGAEAEALMTPAPKDIGALKKRNESLKRSLKALGPKGVFITVDTAHNVLYLMKRNAVVRKAVVSAGSGNVLTDPDGDRSWTFDTPHGEFKIHSKLTDPVWIKPDWAFIEEGEAPPSGAEGRYETGVLGDYALGFGNGFFIHGTLYTRLLGYNVTHGCIRVGDEDLKAVYTAAQAGTRLFIF